MSCPTGQIAGIVTSGAKTNTDGCKVCSAGTYSAGGDLTTCVACAVGKVSTDAASDCVNVCPVG